MRIVKTAIVALAMLGTATSSAGATTIAEYEESFARYTKGTQDFCKEILKNPTQQEFNSCYGSSVFDVTIKKEDGKFKSFYAIAVALDEYKTNGEIALGIVCTGPSDVGVYVMMQNTQPSAEARMSDKTIWAIRKGDAPRREFFEPLMAGKTTGVRGEKATELLDYLAKGDEAPILVEMMTDQVYLGEYKISNLGDTIKAATDLCKL
ncbi:hypothetical protein [Rhizobium laguerreae]|uniref:hypothetical protein n=1 Tax=Rhizobium laguerreae TaxID=1076926 RepID=UPI001C91DA6A|nr:hypothetical protein [Rhizobium laguerreae]MBY3231878.1 hypothetical protein [Rhizobium laguerreae]